MNTVRAAEFAPLQDSVGIITPAALHYVVAHGSPIPDIDPQQHRLLIHGPVDRPLIFTVGQDPSPRRSQDLGHRYRPGVKRTPAWERNCRGRREDLRAAVRVVTAYPAGRSYGKLYREMRG